MTKSLLAAAVLCTFAVSAQAQSSVTLYGIVDQSIGWQSNALGKSLYNMKSGTLSGSRWGLRGSEDLGAGLKAIYVLESGFHLGTGEAAQGGRMFGRQAFVGLSSDQYGTVTFGRQYDSLSDFLGTFGTGATWSGMARAPFDLNNLDSSHRMDNSIKYMSANYNGLQFGGAASLGGIAGKPGKNLVWSLGAGYNSGPLALGVGYLQSKSAEYSPFARVLHAEEKLDALETGDNNPLTSESDLLKSVLSANYRVIAAGGAYSFGAATVSATYSNVRSNTTYQNDGIDKLQLRANLFDLTFNYQLTPALLAGAGYSYSRIAGITLTDGSAKPIQAHQISLGTSYALSKRTDVYLVGAVQKTNQQYAFINSLEPSSRKIQASARIGLRHKF